MSPGSPPAHHVNAYDAQDATSWTVADGRIHSRSTLRREKPGVRLPIDTLSRLPRLKLVDQVAGGLASIQRPNSSSSSFSDLTLDEQAAACRATSAGSLGLIPVVAGQSVRRVTYEWDLREIAGPDRGLDDKRAHSSHAEGFA